MGAKHLKNVLRLWYGKMCNGDTRKECRRIRGAKKAKQAKQLSRLYAFVVELVRSVVVVRENGGGESGDFGPYRSRSQRYHVKGWFIARFGESGEQAT